LARIITPVNWTRNRSNRDTGDELTTSEASDVPPLDASNQHQEVRIDQFSLGFRPGLDGLRALAILAVLGVHATFLWSPSDAAKYLPGGFIGVDVFFALSGFLITSLLMREVNRSGRLNLGSFYRRRAFRLLPVLFVMLVAQLIYTIIIGGGIWYTVQGIFPIVFYVSNWAQVFHLPQPFGTEQTWSLGVEEQFYLMWPILLIAIVRIKNRRMAIAPFVALILAATASRALLWHLNVPSATIYVQTEANLDMLMTGSLLAYLLHTGWRPGVWARRVGYLSFGFLVVAVGFIPANQPWLYRDGGYTVIAFAAAAVVLVALDARSIVGRCLSLPPVRAVGRRAYSLYIVHFLIFLAVVRAWPTYSPVERLACGLLLTVLASELLHRAVEKPFIALKDRSSGPNAPAVISSLPVITPPPILNSHQER
jgi:peptidoglycan/LPS O-acetylase OafA/YrhL